jgi:hypothetical protein
VAVWSGEGEGRRGGPELQSDDKIRRGGFVLLESAEMKSDEGVADNKGVLCSAMMLGGWGELLMFVGSGLVWSGLQRAEGKLRRGGSKF